MLAENIRNMAMPHWIGLFALILLAWAALYAMAVPADIRELGAIYGADFWVSLCAATPDTAGYLKMVAMWVLMSAAMMAPTALPAIAVFDDLSHRADSGAFGRLVWGYFAVWIGFSILAAGVQMALFRLDLISTFGDSRSLWLSAILLGVAGAYQFSSFKDACLTACQQPLTFFIANWSEGPFRNGVRLGAVCLGCCWALMLLAFVGGMASLAFMALATVFMTLEKLPALGRYLTRPLGGFLLCAALVLFVQASGIL